MRRRVGRDDASSRPPLPARVPHVEDVAAPRAGAPGELARVGERVHERQVLAQRMDHLDREADAAAFDRLGDERGVRVGVDGGGASQLAPSRPPGITTSTSAPSACVHSIARRTRSMPARRDARVVPKRPYDPTMRHPRRRRFQQRDRALGPHASSFVDGEADRAEAEPLRARGRRRPRATTAASCSGRSSGARAATRPRATSLRQVRAERRDRGVVAEPAGRPADDDGGLRSVFRNW